MRAQAAEVSADDRREIRGRAFVSDFVGPGFRGLRVRGCRFVVAGRLSHSGRGLRLGGAAPAAAVLENRFNVAGQAGTITQTQQVVIHTAIGRVCEATPDDAIGVSRSWRFRRNSWMSTTRANWALMRRILLQNVRASAQ